MHPDTDELFYVLDGDLRISLLSDTKPENFIAPAGSTFAVPKGIWHKPSAPRGVKFLYLTPGTSLHVESDDPRLD